ncbi:hypothetical protein BV898_14021 [Hypsibius exemplaris]|uniref:F-box domain-containing protein n=1 Tax=Hypsibius exemplaris TaxID=2072580 RepID=A0A1W0W938_HYPEX|nr:hypothetical protein BV898_14021 [Hypsibius exemplaris]
MAPPSGRDFQASVNTTIDKLQDKTLLHIFNFLEHTEISRLAQVSRKWYGLACNSQLWQNVSFRPEFAGIVAPPSIDKAVDLIGRRFGPQLKYIELPIEHICAPVFHELAAKCPNLSHMVLDFSNAMQLHDFNDLNAFPAKLRTLCICLSDVIFMEGFMRKIYNFINSVECLQLIGTYERVTEEEEEVHETLHILKLKSHVPNLRVINFFGVKFWTTITSKPFRATAFTWSACASSFARSLQVIFEDSAAALPQTQLLVDGANRVDQ